MYFTYIISQSHINYINIPQYYVFNNQNKAWIKRQRKHQFNTIGRMSIVSPEDTVRFYLKLLLYKIKGATSFKNLLTVNKTLLPWLHIDFIIQKYLT